MKVLVIIGLLFMIESAVYATEYNNYGEQGIQGVAGTNGADYTGDYASGTAQAMALTGLQFDLNSYKTQFSVAGAYYDNGNGKTADAGAIGVGIPFKAGGKNALVNISASFGSNDSYGVVAGGTIGF